MNGQGRTCTCCGLKREMAGSKYVRGKWVCRYCVKP